MIACVTLCIILFVNNNDNNHNILWGILVLFLGPLTTIVIASIIIHTGDSIKETKKIEDLIQEDLERVNKEEM